MTNNLHCPMSYAVYKFQPETGEFSACCDAVSYKFDAALFDQLQNNYFEKHPELIQRKEDLKRNIKNKDCVQCWKKESQGLTSMRLDLGSRYNTLWNNYNLDTSASYTSRIELWMNSTCNLGCFMCHIGNSNTLRKIWYIDRDTHGHNGVDYNIWLSEGSYDENKRKLFTQSMIDFTVKQLKEVKNYDLSIAYLGGEPTLHSEMYDHADIFIEAGRKSIKNGKKLTIEITTNGTSKDTLNERFYRMFEKYKSAGWQVVIKLSQDGAYDYAQVRHGSNFEQIKQNFSNWIRSDSGIDEIHSFTVLSAINLPYIDHMAKYINEAMLNNFKNNKKLSIQFNTLISPEWMQVKYLPKKFVSRPVRRADKIFKNLKKHYSNVYYNQQLFLNIAMSSNEFISNADAEFFFKNINYVDSVYKKTYPSWSFYNTFPHLTEYANDYGIKI